MNIVALDQRRYKIGGSEAAAACGVDPHRSRIELWASKVWPEKLRRLETPAMTLGKRLQPAIEALLAEDGFEVMPAPAEGFVHEERRWQVVHPDAFVALDGELGLGEWKCRGLSWEDEDAAFAAAIMQLQHGFAVTGYRVGLIAVLHGGYGGLQLDTRLVERDDDLIAKMIAVEEDFLSLVKRAVPPAPDGSESAQRTLRALWPAGRPQSTVRVSSAVADAAKDARVYAAMLDTIKRQHAARVQTIQAAMGDAELAVGPNDEAIAKWTTFARTSIDAAALKATRPELYAKYAITKPVRRFTLE